MVWISYKPLQVTLIEKISNLHALYSEIVLHRTLKIGLVKWQRYNGDTFVLDRLSVLSTVQKPLLLTEFAFYNNLELEQAPSVRGYFGT